jgi:hypothetical protein
MATPWVFAIFHIALSGRINRFDSIPGAMSPGLAVLGFQPEVLMYMPQFFINYAGYSLTPITKISSVCSLKPFHSK